MGLKASLSDIKHELLTKQLEEETRTFLRNVVGADECVRNGLVKVVSNSTQSMTLKSRAHSLLKPIQKEVDEPVAGWLHRHGVNVNWKVSTLIQQNSGELIKTLQNLARSFHGDASPSNAFSRTIDCLIEFVYFCRLHRSKSETVILLKPSKDEEECENESYFRRSNFRKSGSRASSPSKHFPAALDLIRFSLNENGRCISCGYPNAVREQKQRILKSKLGADEKRIKKAFDDNIPVKNELEGARLYCHRHAEGFVGNAGAKKARRTAVAFMSLLYVMRRTEMKTFLNTQFAPEFDFKFAQNVIIQSDPDDFADILVIEGHGILRKKKDLFEKNAACVSGVRAIRKQLPLMLYGTTEEKTIAIGKLQWHIREMMLSFHGVLPSVFNPSSLNQ